ncbi:MULTISPECIES: cation:proton antiporter [unclassified Oceanispirochaeta]|uniref:cation:proton antiporter domain-containing protein n=1 Tax=unclassified Oceanispirochaeta TaxID=2635722 RepID=UPI000E091F72|nr:MULTISPECIES: cation:proton antiporter [unclassified Oceanispirochaeta]MBF9014434.1 cation:proton antiporter [Oceanispirochaeta sp. M2]NPD74988.1 CBS domain-containing protein [Oceanispirochaeta sp. M1]RDG29164.1 CBS domain-containing protein [Oceanispirochaeta sp. M1]
MFQQFINEYFVIDHLNIIFLLGIILFGGTWVGRFFQKLKIPQVVGYICLGVILGKTGFNFIDDSTLSTLQPFNFFALGLIGFMIGGELKTKTLKKYGKQFSLILIMEAFGAFIIVSIAMTFFGIMLFKDSKLGLAFGLLMGAISSATAPAATTDVLWENKTKGPLTTIILGIVAMDDAIALLLFAMATSLAGLLMGQADTSISYSVLVFVWEIGAAIVLGFTAGMVIRQVFKSFIDDDRILAFSIGAILLLIGCAQLLQVDIILTTMSMGFFITNRAPLKSKRTFHVVEKFTPPVYILFFVLVGAKLDISGLTKTTIALALVYIVARIIGKALGAVTGARLSGAPSTVQKYLPFCLLSQAGVAIGLSIVASQTFDGVLGDTIVLVITATTFVVQLVGPSMVKYAVDKSGEAGLNISESDLIQQSKVRDIADKAIPVIREGESVNNILKIFAERDNFYYPVVNKDDLLTGIISIEKLKDTFISSYSTDLLVAHDIMDKVNYTCRMDTEASEIYSIFKKSNIPSIPIVNMEGKVEGIVEYRRIQQLISHRLAELQLKATEMEAS